MTQRSRKLLGTVMLLMLIVVYAIGVGAVYAAFLGEAPWWIHLLYFAAAGLLWFFPAAWLIRWMAKPDDPA